MRFRTPPSLAATALPPLLLLAAALLAACGPRYETFTAYTPPEGEAGRQCLAQCLGARQLCRQSAGLEVQQCRLAAQQEAQAENLLRAAAYAIELQRFQAGLRADEPAAPATVGPSYGPCDGRAAAAERRCTGDHDLCYQNCGGQVTYTTQCVANCE